MFNCLRVLVKSSEKLWVKWKTFRHTLILKKISTWKEIENTEKRKRGKSLVEKSSDFSWRIDGDVRQW